MDPIPEPPFDGALRARASLGLPLPKDARLRFLKRVWYRTNWMFLKHQVAFNEAMIEALRQIRQRQQEWIRSRDERIELALRQANQEIADHIAYTQKALAEMQLHLVRLASQVNELAVESNQAPQERLAPEIDPG